MVLLTRRVASAAAGLGSALVLTLALSVPLAGGAAAAPAATQTSGLPATLLAREAHFADRVLVLVNRKRVAHGLGRVRSNRCVNGFASGWASHLARRNLFEHSNLQTLIRRCEAPYVSENIAEVGPDVTPRHLVSLWMHSPEHRANILSKRPTATGVGIRWDDDQQMWLAVQNFARKPGSYKG
ncbi:MAG: CAP domain-containing protein [Nocardioidaceae bacterium]